MTIEIEYVREGVCLVCGGAVMNDGSHIDPERHAAEVEKITGGGKLLIMTEEDVRQIVREELLERPKLSLFTVHRTPATAPARNTLGYSPTVFEVVAASENEAIGKAQQMSSYAAENFSWTIKDAKPAL